MKTGAFAGLLVFALTAFSSMAENGDYGAQASSLGPQVQFAIPGAGDYDLYESGVGVELQYRNWVNDQWGYLLAVGYADWEADSGATGPGANLYDFDGNIEITPVGGSVIYNAFADDEIMIVLEGGLRFLMIDSKITARNSDHSPATRFDVDIDDTTVVRLAADCDFFLNEDFILSLVLAFQIDVEEGSLSTVLGPGRDNNMDAFLAEIALRMPL